MKLELKHLAPYLPYGLLIYNSYTGCITEMVIDSLTYKQERKTELNGGNILLNILNSNVEKPILRPMSDLIPLEHGEVNDFILIKLVNETDQHCDAYDEWRDSFFDNPEPSRILQAPYEIFEELLKQHYDVFGLIPAGLAIDINTLKV